MHARGPRKERRLTSQAQVVSRSGWVCRVCGVGRHDSKGQPPGVLLLLGKWEALTCWPKENKPRTEQYTVYCLSDTDQPHCVCSIRHGPNQPQSKQCSVLKENQSQLDSLLITSNLKLADLKRQQGRLVVLNFYSFGMLSFMLWLHTKYLADNQSREEQAVRVFPQPAPHGCKERKSFSRQDRPQPTKFN